MPPLAQQTTAEHVVGCVDAVVSYSRPTDHAMVAAFLDIQEKQAKAALNTAVELGLLRKSGTNYSVGSPLCRFLATSNQPVKAAILRIVIEAYEPFTVFRARLETTLDLNIAARQTKSQLALGASREEVKETLISLGTFSQALLPDGGGRYRSGVSLLPDAFGVIAKQAIDLTSAAQRIRAQLGPVAGAFSDEASVIGPLANALIRAGNGDARGAVVEAGNGVESHVTALAVAASVSLVGATGIGAKLDRFGVAPARLPKKLIAVGKYLSNVRNAADHGVDSDVGKAWDITESTGLEYVFVACTFIRTSHAYVANSIATI